MTRQAGRVSETTYDLLVIGGGIHGLFAAEIAAARGLRVALIERGDYGSGLSFNHQRTVHGGLRSLQTWQAIKTRQQVAERRRWALMAPGQIRVLPFLVGTYRGTKRSRSRIGIGLRLYDLIGYDRNDALPSRLHTPASRLISPAEAERAFPGVHAEGLTGGAVWHDYQVLYPDRLNWLVAVAAMGQGAQLSNYVEATGALRSQGRIAGARVRDVLSGEERLLHATMTLFCVGAELPSLLSAFGLDDTPPPLVAAANLLLSHTALPMAVAASGRSGRMLTAVPWAGRTLVGTFQSSTPVAPSSVFPLVVGDMLDEANAAFPALQATRSDVCLVHRGLTPAIVRSGAAELLPDHQLIRHRLRGVPGAISLVGVKFTTARIAAREAVSAAMQDMGRVEKADEQLRGLPHGTEVSIDAPVGRAMKEAGMAPDIVAHLVGWYGTEVVPLWNFVGERALTARLSPMAPVIEGEIAYAVEHGHARRLADAVLRRTSLGATGHPGERALARAAEIMSGQLGWSAERRLAEISAVIERYKL